MILAVSLNPCLDRIVFVPELKVSTLNRGLKSIVSAGGKGVNVAKVISALGEPVSITGFFAGSAGKYIVDTLETRNVKTYPVWIRHQETRTTTNILELTTEKETEITEPGPEISQDMIAAFMDTYIKLVVDADVVVLSGSAPMGIQDDIYAVLIGIAKKHGKKTILDTGGVLLKKGIEAAPDTVKPNVRELNALTGTDLRSLDQLVDQCDFLHHKGIQNVCVSMGKDGALLSCPEGRYTVPAFPVDVVNTIGCGDAMVAGLAVSIKRGYQPLEMLRFASACAASNAGFQEIGMIDNEQVYRLIRGL